MFYGKNKEKTYSEYTKDKEKKIKVCHCRKLLIHKGLQQEREKRRTQNSQKIINKMALVSPYLSIITLNINKLNSLIKRYRVTEWIKIQDPTIFHLREIHFSSKDTYRLKLKQRVKIFHYMKTKLGQR